MSRNSKTSSDISRFKFNVMPGAELGNDVLSDLNKAWESVHELKHKLQRTEDNLHAAGRESFRHRISSVRPKYTSSKSPEEPAPNANSTLHQPVRKISRFDKVQDLDVDVEKFQKSANGWSNDIGPLHSIRFSKHGIDHQDDPFMYWDKWMNGFMEQKKDVGPSEEPVEPTRIRIINDHFEIYAANLREDLVKNMGIASVTSPSRPPPKAPASQYQKQGPKTRPSMVTKTKNVCLNWEPVKYTFPVTEKEDVEEKKHITKVTHSGQDSNNKMVEESEGAKKHSRDSSTSAHLVSRGTDTEKKPLTVKKVVCSASKIEERAIKPSSWRRGQQLILKELGPNSLLQRTPPAAVTATEETDSVNYSTLHPPADQEPVLVSDSGKDDKEIKIPLKKKARKSKRHDPLKHSSPKVRHYDQEVVRKFMKQQKIERKKRREEDDQQKLNIQEKKRQLLEKLDKKQKELAKVNLSEKKKNVPNTPLSPPQPSPVIIAEDPLDWLPATFSHLRKKDKTSSDSKGSVSSGSLSAESVVENVESALVEEKENELPSMKTPNLSEAVSSVASLLPDDSRKMKLRDIALQALKIQERIKIEAKKLQIPVNAAKHQEQVPNVDIDSKFETIKDSIFPGNEIPVNKQPDLRRKDTADASNAAKSENGHQSDIFQAVRLQGEDARTVTDIEADPMNFINTLLRKLRNDFSTDAHVVSTNVEPIKIQQEEISVAEEQEGGEVYWEVISSPSQHTVSLSEVEVDEASAALEDVSEGPVTEDDTDTAAELLSLPQDSKDAAQRSAMESKQSSILAEKENQDQLGSLIRRNPAKMSPSKLHLRMNTELTYMDSLHESLQHLAQMEHLRALAMSQHETAALARALQGKALDPDEEMNISNVPRTRNDGMGRRIWAQVPGPADAGPIESSPSHGSLSSMSLEVGPVEVSEEIYEQQISQEVPEQVLKEVMSEDMSGVSEGRLSMESFQDERSRTFKMLLPSESHRRKSFGNSSEMDRTSSASPDAGYKVIRSQSQPFSGEESLREFTLAMVKQFMEEEEMRGKHQKALLKLREEAIVEKTRAEISWLHMLKKRLQDKGADDKLPHLRQKERGLLFRLRREQVEIKNMREAHKVASHQRQIILRQQQKVLRLRLSTEQLWSRLRKMTPDKPFAVSRDETSAASTSTMNSGVSNKDDHSTLEENEDIPEESFSIESPLRTESIRTQIQRSSPEGDGDAVQAPNNREDSERSSMEVSVVLRKLETTKRHLTKREQRLHKRCQDVEELLKWHQRLNEDKERVREMEKKTLELLEKEKGWHNLSLTLSQSVGNLESKDGTSSVSEHVISDASTSVVEDVEEVSSEQHTTKSRTDDNDVLGEVTTSVAETRYKSPVSIHLPLTTVRKRLDSSGSEGSATLSHSETVSDMSDVEGRIRALKDDLRRRKLEAEKLKRERLRRNRERLKAREESLVKQIEAYDTFIERAQQDLRIEMERSVAVSQVKPQIKKPKVAESRRIKTSDGAIDRGEPLSPLASPVSEEACSPLRCEEDASFHEISKDNLYSSSLTLSPESHDNSSLLQKSDLVEHEASKRSETIAKSKGEEESSSSSSSCGVLSSVSIYYQKENGEKPSEPEVTIEENDESVTRQSFSLKSLTLPSNTKKSQDEWQIECDRFTEVFLEEFLEEDVTILGKYFEPLRASVSEIPISGKEPVVALDRDKCRALHEDVTDEILTSGFEEAFQEVRSMFAVKTWPGHVTLLGHVGTKSETSVSQRVHEILAKFSDKSPHRFPKTTPQDLLVLSPPVTYVDALTAHDTRQEIQPAPVGTSSQLTNEEEDFFNDQEWFEDDLGLEEPAKSPHEQVSSQTSDAQNYQIYQYEDSFYIREIPNKPPPPYSLPAGHSDQQGFAPTLEPEDYNYWKQLLPEPVLVKSVVEDEKAVATVVRHAAQRLFTSGTVPEKHVDAEDIGDRSGYEQVFQVFLDDLSRDLVRKFSCDTRKITRQGPSDKDLPDAVAAEALALMGLDASKRRKVSWVGKKRDFVDEILIEELRKEENHWISYEEDEFAVKQQIVDVIFQELVEDTVLTIRRILIQ